VRALYGLDHMTSTLRSLGFKGCLADPDVWLRPACKPDGTKYYKYVLIYVDDYYLFHMILKKVMYMLSEHYTLKKGSVKAPTEYLVAEIKTYRQDKLDSRVCWAMSCDLYVKRAVKEVQQNSAKTDEKQLSNKTVTPLTAGYRPELDATPELDDAKANYFQGLIGVLRWMIELGHIDIMLSCYFAKPYGRSS
jgi:hypothetical protein